MKFCFDTESSDAQAVAPKGVDEYIMDCVYGFRHKTTKILMDLYEVYKLSSFFQNFLFCGMSKEWTIPTGRTNIFRPLLFTLFPNLVEMQLRSFHYDRFNLLSVLSVLNESVIPSSFKVVMIEDYQGRWLKEHFNSIPNVEEHFAAKNWDIEQETIGQKQWVFIKKQQ